MSNGEKAHVWVALVVFLVSMTTSSCAVLRVTHGTGGTATVPGVPFYAKKAKCRQEIVWLEPVYNLALSALFANQTGVPQSQPYGAVSLQRSTFVSGDVTNLIKLINAPNAEPATVQQYWQKISAAADASTLSHSFQQLGSDDKILVGRSSTPFPYVDYSDQYFLNARVPLAGSANIDAKLAPDGSLTEASGQVQSNTLQTVLSNLPISTLITGGLGLGGKGLVETGKLQSFQLTITITGYRHTLARLVDYASPCPVPPEITLADASEYKREDITTGPPSTKDASQVPQQSESNPKKEKT